MDSLFAKRLCVTHVGMEFQMHPLAASREPGGELPCD
jgi:hypothetical protein